MDHVQQIFRQFKLTVQWWDVAETKKSLPCFIIFQCKRNHSVIFSDTVRCEDQGRTTWRFSGLFVSISLCPDRTYCHGKLGTRGALKINCAPYLTKCNTKAQTRNLAVTIFAVARYWWGRNLENFQGSQGSTDSDWLWSVACCASRLLTDLDWQPAMNIMHNIQLHNTCLWGLLDHKSRALSMFSRYHTWHHLLELPI